MVTGTTVWDAGIMLAMYLAGMRAALELVSRGNNNPGLHPY